MPCGTVRCCAALCCLSYIQYQVSCDVPGTTYRYVPVYSCFSVLNCLSCLGPLHDTFLQIYTRTADQNVTSPASTQHSTGESGQVALGIINSLGAPNHGPLLSATFTCCCLLPCARVATSAARGAEPLCLSILICVLPVST